MIMYRFPISAEEVTKCRWCDLCIFYVALNDIDVFYVEFPLPERRVDCVYVGGCAISKVLIHE